MSMPVLCTSFVVLLLLAVVRSGSVMPWLCLERCGASSEQIASDVQQILQHTDVFDRVSFELYNLGPDGQLITNSQLSPVGPKFVASGVASFPMVSSFPYPPQFLSWMRSLWSHPDVGDRFIASAVSACQQNGWSGLNIDWEPVDQPGAPNATAQDGLDYAAFLNHMAAVFHQHNLELTVDIGSWSPIWNMTALSQTLVDRIITMQTYTSNLTSFTTHFKQASSILQQKLSVGLAAYHLDTNTSWAPWELDARFDLIEGSNVTQVDVWCSPIQDVMMPYLQRFKQ
jgi:hypothetical protein